jgi:hypothetical protein
MNMPLAAHSIVSTLSTWWRDRQEANRQLEEIAALSYDDLAEVASDCGVTPYELIAVVKAGPHGADELKEMLTALELDGNAIEINDRRMMNDMIATCAECDAKGQCRRDLRDGLAADNYAHYCANAETLNELRAAPEQFAR